MKRKDKYNYQFNWESINDVIYYMEWKLEEIAEAGCNLEYPSAEKTLKDLTSFRDYLRLNDPDEKFIYKPDEKFS
tara:strand:- start:141 stop:365 length:225 start_codon:yes stop_codon:yes gene_type:complete